MKKRLIGIDLIMFMEVVHGIVAHFCIVLQDVCTNTSTEVEMQKVQSISSSQKTDTLFCV